MRLTIFLLLLIQVYLPHSCSQANRHISKGYAYSRETLQGAAPTIKVEENGTAIETVRQAAQQYYIYVEVANPADAEVKYVWISGKKYNAGITEVLATPVVISNPSVTMETDTLVAKTANKVWQIQPGQQINVAKQMAPAAKAGVTDEVVIEYTYKNKPYHYAIHSIKKLHPVALQ